MGKYRRRVTQTDYRLAGIGLVHDMERAAKTLEASKIVARFDPPPIRDRRFDWSAVSRDYEPGMPIGYGTTKEEALADFREQMENQT
jgi:hypothetical protein